jgi:hypothetical protein
MKNNKKTRHYDGGFLLFFVILISSCGVRVDQMRSAVYPNGHPRCVLVHHRAAHRIF